MEERSKLFTVIVTADQTSCTVAIYLAISLTFGAGILRGTTWSGEEMSSLACSGLGKRNRNWFWFDAAIVFLVEERSELFAIVVTTDKTSSTVAISLAISLAFGAGILRGTARPGEEISAFAPLERFSECDHVVN